MSTDSGSCDALIAAAVREAADGEIYVPGLRPEEALRKAVQEKFEDATRTEVQESVVRWDPQPRGVDLVIDRPAAGRIAIEFKVGHVDQSLWDLLKLCAVGLQSDIAATFLIYDAPKTHWSADRACTELFAGPEGKPHVFSVRPLIERWPKAWADLLCGGSARPRKALPHLVTRLVCKPTHSKGQIRAVAVAFKPACRWLSFDDEGWPANAAVDAQWREYVRARRTGTAVPQAALRERRRVDPPPDRTRASIVGDDEGRLWADVWDRGETVPTSFRLTDTDPARYDLRRAKNDALSFVDPAQPLPAWCSRQVADAHQRFSRGQERTAH